MLSFQPCFLCENIFSPLSRLWFLFWTTILLQFHYYSLTKTAVVIKSCYWILGKTAVLCKLCYSYLTTAAVSIKACYQKTRKTRNLLTIILQIERINVILHSQINKGCLITTGWDHTQSPDPDNAGVGKKRKACLYSLIFFRYFSLIQSPFLFHTCYPEINKTPDAKKN